MQRIPLAGMNDQPPRPLFEFETFVHGEVTLENFFDKSDPQAQSLASVCEAFQFSGGFRKAGAR
jgi:hypothetical protein